MRSGRFVCHYVRMQLISLKLAVLIVATNLKNWSLTFSADPVPDKDSGSLFHFEVGDFSRLAFLIQSPAIFSTLGEMTDADNVVNPRHFGSDSADVRIGNRILIRPEILIRIPFYFLLRFALTEHSLVSFGFRYSH